MADLSNIEASTVVLHVGGMTCGSCERHVGDALRRVPGVENVAVGREAGTATIAWATTVPDVNALVDAVLAAGYDASVASVSGSVTPLPPAPARATGCGCCEVRA